MGSKSTGNGLIGALVLLGGALVELARRKGNKSSQQSQS